MTTAFLSGRHASTDSESCAVHVLTNMHHGMAEDNDMLYSKEVDSRTE